MECENCKEKVRGVYVSELGKLCYKCAKEENIWDYKTYIDKDDDIILSYKKKER